MGVAWAHFSALTQQTCFHVQYLLKESNLKILLQSRILSRQIWPFCIYGAYITHIYETIKLQIKNMFQPRSFYLQIMWERKWKLRRQRKLKSILTHQTMNFEIDDWVNLSMIYPLKCLPSHWELQHDISFLKLIRTYHT